MDINTCEYRNMYTEFIYKSYEIQQGENEITLSFNFEIPGLCEFRPATVIKTGSLKTVNPIDSENAKQIVFSLGLCECVSYFKAVLPKRLTVKCGYLSEDDKKWWKKLYFNGLGEFLYRNSIETREDELIDIITEEKNIRPQTVPFNTSEYSVIPIGGGKDSAVTVSLLKKQEKDKLLFFTVNDQQARTDTVISAGYTEKNIIKTYRTIDKNLLELNKKGFLNGHTPFSAIVAFLSAYCAYITGAENIILSNEASANESNIEGLSVNHQYSKSYEFEKDFSSYITKKSNADIKYFSLLRPFNELQIAKYFSGLPEFHKVFRSCNAGSKKNIWCAKCPKCLFVYCILSPFIEKNKLDEIFGGCMTDKKELLEDFKGLAGLSPVKPFECVGTVSELKYALDLTVKSYEKQGIELPYLLAFYKNADNADFQNGNEKFLEDFNSEHGIPDKFIPAVKEMYEYVSQSR